jgi:hypothetical protein
MKNRAKNTAANFRIKASWGVVSNIHQADDDACLAGDFQFVVKLMPAVP